MAIGGGLVVLIVLGTITLLAGYAIAVRLGFLKVPLSRAEVPGPEVPSASTPAPELKARAPPEGPARRADAGPVATIDAHRDAPAVVLPPGEQTSTLTPARSPDALAQAAARAPSPALLPAVAPESAQGRAEPPDGEAVGDGTPTSGQAQGAEFYV
jgi:hypothetical protein